MPTHFDLDRAERIVLSRVWGKVTDADMLTHMEGIRELFKRGELDSTWAQIYDGSDIESTVDVSTACIRRMAIMNPWPKESVRALIAPKDSDFGLARMYQLMGEPQTERVHVLRALANATAFIKKERTS